MNPVRVWAVLTIESRAHDLCGWVDFVPASSPAGAARAAADPEIAVGSSFHGCGESQAVLERLALAWLDSVFPVVERCQRPLDDGRVVYRLRLT